MTDVSVASAPDPSPAGRFSLRRWRPLVTAAVAVLAIGLIVFFGVRGSLLTLLILMGVAAFRGAWKTTACLFAVAVVGFYLEPRVPTPAQRETARRIECMDNLQQLSIALHAYHNAYGSFPPAYVADKKGRPMHSWRVLILPFLDQEELYKKYRFDEPWDGPNNKILVNEMPPCYRCPNQPAGFHLGETNYVAVVGPRAAWRTDRAVVREEIRDGDLWTILVVETKDSGIPWTAPRDLPWPPMPTQVNPSSGAGISSRHPGGAMALFADGYVYFLPDSNKKVAAMLTIDGGEPVTEKDLEYSLE
ncbi:MAG TPA: DUF1559 domain-containing protein [Thermoguttaceae bacterium]|nr:DUF1559 domain-containing protein [Thermoguttaceae bacterium]